MMKKMCPVCDIPLTAGGYCKYCKKLVRNPYIQNVDYYLNERHPENETQCDYHKPDPVGDRRREAKAKAKASVQPVANPAVKPNMKPAVKPITSSSAKPVAGDSHTGRYVLAALSAAFVIITAVTIDNVSGSLPNYLRRMVEPADAYEYNYNYETEFKTLTDGEVVNAGKECTGYSHFPGDGGYVADKMAEGITNSGYGYEIIDEFYSDNYLIQDTSYFESIRSFCLTDTSEENEDTYHYVEVNYDTATGRIHEYSSSLNEEAAALTFLEQFLTAVEESGAIPPKERVAAEIMEEVGNSVSLRQDHCIHNGLFVVELFYDESDIHVYVSVSALEGSDGVEL